LSEERPKVAESSQQTAGPVVIDIGMVVSLNVEEFATTILTDVDYDGTSSLLPAIAHEWAHLGPSAEFLKFGLNEVWVHVVMDTGDGG